MDAMPWLSESGAGGVRCYETSNSNGSPSTAPRYCKLPSNPGIPQLGLGWGLQGCPLVISRPIWREVVASSLLLRT